MPYVEEEEELVHCWLGNCTIEKREKDLPARSVVLVARTAASPHNTNTWAAPSDNATQPMDLSCVTCIAKCYYRTSKNIAATSHKSVR